MNDLTEKWKKGELSVGEYYLLYKDGTTDREYYDWANVYGRVTEKGFSTDQNDIKEVLAEVPDYVEWRNMVNCACEEHEANKRLIEENAQLKEQINKCYLDAINSGTANAVKAVKEFGMPERIKELVEQNAQLKELLKGCSIANTALISIMDWLQSSVISEQKEQCKKLFENTQELQKQIDEALK